MSGLGRTIPPEPSKPEQDEPLRVEPISGLRGSTTVPGDKSISHRCLILGALATGRTRVRNLSPGQDVYSTWRCLEQLGVEIERPGEEILVNGQGGGPFREPEDVLDVGNSGTTMRLLAGVLCAQPIFSVLSGDPSIRRRPMERIVKPLCRMGAEIWARQGGRLAPLAIRGGTLHPIRYESPVASAQVKTAVLLAGLFLEGETSVIEPHPSRDHTERMLGAMDAEIESRPGRVVLRGGRPLRPLDVSVPGDPSSAAFLVVGALITRTSELEIRQVCMNPTRVGFLRVLERMGALVEVRRERELCGEPVADLVVRSSRLRATTIQLEEVPACIDEIPVLCVAASVAEGRTRIAGAGELRVKESDRIAAMASNLSGMGVEVIELPDGLEIVGRGTLKAFEGRSWGDHRIALSLIVAALAAEGPSRIFGTACGDVSFPGFLEHVASLSGR